MIPKYQRILFWSLTGCILIMFLFLLRGCEQAHARFTNHGDLTPLAAPTPSENVSVMLAMASDADVSITPTSRQVPLPEEPSLRARALLENLLDLYAQPRSAHAREGGPGIDDVYLLTMPAPALDARNRFEAVAPSGGLTAVVNLHGAFADHHPSGVVVETLTLQSIIGTLHATLPDVAQVRFLVDGKARETLAGHASLLRAYPAVDTANRPAVDGN